MIIATAGHIDHGKTTLVKALTGVDTDRLPEEKARGISIDLGFAYWQTADGETVGFVDVPGHERFIRNMLAGVCGIDYVMLIVAADDGVMPQTVEHLHIVNLLNVTRGIAVITKTDRVPAERMNEVIAGVRSLLAATSLASIPILPASAISGEGVPQLREALRIAAKEHRRSEGEGRNFRYAIDRAFTIAGSGTVVTGTVFNGVVSVGDKLMLTPSGIEVRIRGIQQHGQAAQKVAAGERCALNLIGADLAQISRGDWIVAPQIHAPTQRLDVRLQVLTSEGQPLKHWTPVHLHMGTDDVTARIAIRRGAAIAPGESGIAQIIADRPLAALHGDRFIIRDQSAARTLGGGSVIDPFAPTTRRNSATRQAQLAALEEPTPGAALKALLACSPQGVDLIQFERTFNLTTEHVEKLVRECGAVILGKDQRLALPQAIVETTKQNVLAALTRFHKDSPQALGAETETQRKAYAPALSNSAFGALLRELADQHKIEIKGSLLRLPQHVATANPADEKMWQTIKPALDAAAFKVPPVRELAATTRVQEAALKDFLHRKSRTGEVLRVAQDRFYPRETMAKLAAIALTVSKTTPNGQFTPAQYRDSTGVGRSLAMEILECLDRLGITQRLGDTRKMRKDFVPILGPATADTPPSGNGNNRGPVSTNTAKQVSPSTEKLRKRNV